MKKLRIIIAFLAISIMVGCAGKPITFKNVDPKLYEHVQDRGHTITAKAGGFALFNLIPMRINSRHERAYNHLKKQANGGYITDIKVRESWTFWLVGNSYATYITATVYPNVPVPKKETENLSEKLNKIKELYEKGILTKEEYDAKREKLINNY